MMPPLDCLIRRVATLVAFSGRTSALLALAVLFCPAVRAGNPNLLFTQLPDFNDTAASTFQTVLADLNGDGRPDLIRSIPASGGGAGSVGVQLGLGSGSFAAGAYYPAGALPGPQVVADFNNDGKLDVVVANLGSADNGSLSVLPGNGNGTLQGQIVINLGIVVRRLVVTDYNKDGKADIVAIGYPSGSIPLETRSVTLPGNGDGTFGTPATYANSARTGFPDTRDVVVGDFNGDTWPDFVVSNPVGYAIAVFFNNQDGTFTRREREMQIPGNVASLATADFNGDGKLDLAVVTASDTTYGNTGAGNNVAVVDGNGDGTFGTLRTDLGPLDFVNDARIYSAGPAGDTFVRPGTRLLTHDMDGDGELDLLLLAEPSQGLYNILSILRGAGDGTFSPGAQLVTTYGSLWMSVADLNNDTAMDLIVTPNGSTTQTYLGIPPGGGTLLVTTALDEDNGTADPNVGAGTSLREAWNQALTQVTPQTINFAANLAGQTIHLTTVGSTISGPSALRLPPGRNVTVQGLPGAAGITIDGGGSLRPFFVDLDFGGSGSGTLTLNDLTIQNGRSTFGGGIFNLGTLTMRRCTLTRNSASNQGGALYTGASYATGAQALLVNCTIADNTGLNPGIMSDSARLDLVNVTIRGNLSPGGITSGGGIRIAGGSTVTLTNTIVAGNTPSDIDGGNVQASSRHNLIGIGGSGGLVNGVDGNLVGVANVRLAALGNYGGPTPTMALLLDSPARNAGIADPEAPADQRGVVRPQETAPDIGAFELQPAPPQIISDNGATFIMGASNTFTFVASGSPPSMFTTSSPLPAGVTLAASGVLSGNPSTSAAGVYPLTVEASNGVAPVASQSFTLTVVEAGSLVVDTADDVVSAYDGVTSLREAVAYAATLPGSQAVTFAPALAGQTVTLNTGWNDSSDHSALRVTGNLTIQGPADFPGITLAVAPGVAKRHLLVEGSGSLTLERLTLTGGSGDYGGAVWSLGSLTVRGCTFTGNHATAEGGAIQCWGDSPSFLIENSTLAGNSSAGIASAIDAGAASMTLRHLTITGNTAANALGALVLWKNQATLVNSIVAGNSDDGLGLVNGGTFSAQSANNLIGTGGSGGLANGVNGNLVGVSAASLYLGPLANNGGPTQTMALLPGSPAIDAGVAIAGLTTDQRGLARMVGPAPDIGAFELVPSAAPAPQFAPAGGIHQGSVTVALSTTPGTTTIRYTTDGSTPSESHGDIYAGPFTLWTGTTVRAVAYGSGWLPSPTASASYTVRSGLQGWRAIQGLAADGSQDLANPSGDGVPNLLKYAFNLAPNAGDLLISNQIVLPPDGTAGLPRITADATPRLVIQFLRRQAATNPGIAYVVEVGPDLATWSALDPGLGTVESIDAIWERVTITDPVGAAARFGRVRVIRLDAYANNFDAGIGPATLRGTAVWTDQAVMLTDAIGGQLGAVVFEGVTAGPATAGFTARFTMNLGPAAHPGPADGINFAVGDLGAPPQPFAA
jgi:hypothetical protein